MRTPDGPWINALHEERARLRIVFITAPQRWTWRKLRGIDALIADALEDGVWLCGCAR